MTCSRWFQKGWRGFSFLKRWGPSSGDRGMADAIVTQGLTKYYGRRCVVNSLALHVPAGSVYGLLGRNGSGKSTTIKMLMGFARPDRGTPRLLDEDAQSLSPATRARIAYIAEGHPFFRWMTIDEAVRF